MVSADEYSFVEQVYTQSIKRESSNFEFKAANKMLLNTTQLICPIEKKNAVVERIMVYSQDIN